LWKISEQTVLSLQRKSKIWDLSLEDLRFEEKMGFEIWVNDLNLFTEWFEIWQWDLIWDLPITGKACAMGSMQ